MAFERTSLIFSSFFFLELVLERTWDGNRLLSYFPVRVRLSLYLLQQPCKLEWWGWCDDGTKNTTWVKYDVQERITRNEHEHEKKMKEWVERIRREVRGPLDLCIFKIRVKKESPTRESALIKAFIANLSLPLPFHPVLLWSQSFCPWLAYPHTLGLLLFRFLPTWAWLLGRKHHHQDHQKVFSRHLRGLELSDLHFSSSTFTSLLIMPSLLHYFPSLFLFFLPSFSESACVCRSNHDLT